jgi:hypothetical protein
MAVHTSLFYSAGVKTTPYDAVGAVVDQVLGYRNGAHVPSVPMSLVALAATGFLNDGMGKTTTLSSARVQSPKTVISPVYVRPINILANFPTDPSVNAFPVNPVVMRPGEEISASATLTGTGGATTGPAAIVAWFYDRLEPVLAAESYWVPFSAELPATGSTSAWNTTAITFQDTTTLPAGRYAILGMHLVRPSGSPDLLCGRLVIPGETLRPGTVTSPTAAALTPPFASDGSFGTWGHFDAQLPPSLEVFSPTVMAGSVSGFIRVAQVSR